MKQKLVAMMMAYAGVVPVMGATVVSDGNVTIRTYLSEAPNAFSPSWNTYATTAVNWLRNGGSFGDESIDPSAYTQTGATVGLGAIIVSNFNSWKGQANPTGVFASEYGTRLLGGVAIEANLGVTFTLEDVTWSTISTSVGDLYAVGDFVGTSFTSTRIGVSPDGLTTYTSGSAEGVDLSALYYVGLGNAFDSSGQSGPSDQEKLDQTTAYIESLAPLGFGVKYGVTYTGSDSGTFSGSDTVLVIPEPSVVMLGAIGILALFRRRNR